MMSTLVQPNLRLDFKALREQKAELVRVIARRHADSSVRNDVDLLDGILHVIDEIQDQAVATKVATERLVFGTNADTQREIHKDTVFEEMQAQSADIRRLWETWQTNVLRIFQTRTHKNPETFGLRVGEMGNYFLAGHSAEDMVQKFITDNKITTAD